MCLADRQAFGSFAHAQVAITNEVYQHLGEPETFLFCPTGATRAVNSMYRPFKNRESKGRSSCFVFADYCAAFCAPSVSQSSYLHTVGENLLPGIDILWTGKVNQTRAFLVFFIVSMSLF